MKIPKTHLIFYVRHGCQCPVCEKEISVECENKLTNFFHCIHSSTSPMEDSGAKVNWRHMKHFHNCNLCSFKESNTVKPR